MSWVANVMLSVGLLDNQLVPSLSRWLDEDAPRRYEGGGTGVGSLSEASEVDAAWGGAKRPECDLWLGALNHADLDAVRARVAAMPWREPQLVQLFLMDQEDLVFNLWMMEDGALVRVTDLSPELSPDQP